MGEWRDDNVPGMSARALELYARWGAVGDPQALYEAVVLLRRCLDLLPEGNPDRPMALSNLCCALRDHYALHPGGTGPDGLAEARLDEAVAAGRYAVATAHPGDPRRWMYHGNLAGALIVLLLTRQPGAAALADEAVGHAHEAVRRAPHPHAVFLDHLGVALSSRAAQDRTDAADDVRGAVDAFRAAVHATDPRDRQFAVYLNHLGGALRRRALLATDRCERIDDLREALEHTRGAAQRCPPDDPNHAGCLAELVGVVAALAEYADTAEYDALVDTERQDLAAVPAEWRVQRMWVLVALLRLRYDRTDEPRDLEEAIDICRRALRAGPGALAVPYLCELGSAHLARFRQTRDPVEVEAALDTARQAVAAAIGPNRVRAQELLAHTMAARYRLAPSGAASAEEGGAEGDEAVAALEAVRRLLPAGSAELAQCLGELGLTWLTRADRLRLAGAKDAAGALDRAVTVLREAAEVRGATGAYTVLVLLALGRALRQLHHHRGDTALLDETVRRLEEAAAIAAEGSTAQLAEVLSALGMALRERAENRDSLADLHRAVELTGRAVTVAPPASAERAGWLAHYCAALLTRYHRLSTVPDLEEAVRAGREAVSLAPSHTRAVSLTNLGSALRRMYERTGASADLDEAAEALREAAAIPGGDNAGEAASGLATVLSERYDRTQDTAELEEAIDAARLAVGTYPQGHMRRAEALMSLTLILLNRCRLLERQGDADEAVRCAQEAADILPEGRPARARALLGLSQALLARHQLRPSVPDLHEATAVARAALRAQPADDPRRVAFLVALGLALSFDYPLRNSRRRLRKARAAFREAAAIEGVPTKVRFSATAHWALRSAMLEDWKQAVDAYQSAVARLPLMAWHGLQLEDRVSGLAASDSITGDAAAAALCAGRPETALHLLEQGRGILLAQEVDPRFELETLEEQEPRLARRIAEIRSVLHSADSALTDPSASAHKQRAEAHRHRELAAELDQLTRDAYRLLGLDDLLRPPSTEELREAAGDGAVVVVNTSFLRCDAFVITRDTLRTVSLPDLSLEEPGGLRDRSEALLTALAAASRSPDEAGRVLRDTLAWLGETVVAPVLPALPPAGRLWWCPTGLLALLPLHAVDGIAERYVCSYAATLRSLARARRRQGNGRRTGDGLLIVDQADVPGLPPLPYARKEAIRLLTQVSDRKLLTGRTADRRTVRRALSAHACLHFAGHARHDPADPARSGLLCHGGRRPGLLTVEDIARLRLDTARLAFLSACETARGTARLPDEPLHLAGALQLAGFTHVVAAQWVAEDATTQELTAHFYASLSRPEDHRRLDPARAPFALHTAVQHVRRRNADPLFWAAYVHTGP
ncbi:CHAT domain-containing protein [Streptomyces sp. NPDC023723]|uniref:CHAT domain-containing protein n=1 Tax=Streptomyces sp. NPDC023723 TaxID=3154323 RepID=UPI0033E6808C